jgi:hypothetical protein
MVKVYDNGGATYDRYTVIIKTDTYTMSDNALSPQGFNQYCGSNLPLPPNRPVKLSSLPEQVQRAIALRIDSYLES